MVPKLANHQALELLQRGNSALLTQLYSNCFKFVIYVYVIYVSLTIL